MPSDENKKNKTEEYAAAPAPTKTPAQQEPTEVQKTEQQAPITNQDVNQPKVEEPQKIVKEPATVSAPATEKKTPATEKITTAIPKQAPAPTKTAPQTSSQPVSPTLIQTQTVIHKPRPNIIKKLLIKARQHIQKRRQKRLDKILTALRDKKKMTNKEIRQVVRVSDATIVRYMDILEKEDKVRQVGKTGKHVYYKPV